MPSAGGGSYERLDRSRTKGPSMETLSAKPIDPLAVAEAERQMIKGPSERRMRKLLDVLCDPTRVKIVRALRDNELAASDLARVLERSRSATSQHLRVLREADIVQPTRRGNIVRYRLSQELNAEILDDVGRAFDRLESEKQQEESEKQQEATAS